MIDEKTKKKIRLFLKGLFESSKTNGPFEFILTLIRVGGITHERDPLLVLKDDLIEGRDDYKPQEGLSLLANLVNCASKKPYDAFPFRVLWSGDSFNRKAPSTDEMINFLNIQASSIKGASVIKNAYASKENFEYLLKTLIETYETEKRKFIGDQLVYKMPRFETLELLVDPIVGLNGFKMHFSNDSTAWFERKENSTMGINILGSEVPINFMAGMLNELKPKWRFNGKDLYETGLPFRYNPWGTWHPIVYPGAHEEIDKTCHEIAGKDSEVYGTLFYIMTTGHRVVEFTFKTLINLPITTVKLGSAMHIHKVQSKDEEIYPGKSIIYDGLYELEEITPKAIRTAIASINVGLNRIAFSYGKPIQWTLKYKGEVRHPHTHANPTKKDLKVLDAMLKEFPSSEEAIILDIGVDWYHRAEAALRGNVFLAFLCYYIAIESIALEIADGKVNLGLNFTKLPKNELRAKIVADVRKRHDEDYEKDPLKFVREAYFDDIGPNKPKTKKVLESIFGEKHKYIDMMFNKKREPYCFSDLRGQLAHGGITLLAREHEQMVQESLPEMAEISRNFLKRLIFYPKGPKKIPRWSGKMSMSLVTADPRTTHVVSDLKMLGRDNDWKIKPEWIDS
jgi:hypothetical protein